MRIIKIYYSLMKYILLFVCFYSCSFSLVRKEELPLVYMGENRLGEVSKIELYNNFYWFYSSCQSCSCEMTGEWSKEKDTIFFKSQDRKKSSLDAMAKLERMTRDTLKITVIDELGVLLSGMSVIVITTSNSASYTLNKEAVISIAYTLSDSIKLDLGVYTSKTVSLKNALDKGFIDLHSKMPCTSGCFINLGCNKFLLRGDSLECFSSFDLFYLKK